MPPQLAVVGWFCNVKGRIQLTRDSRPTIIPDYYRVPTVTSVATTGSGVPVAKIGDLRPWGIDTVISVQRPRSLVFC